MALRFHLGKNGKTIIASGQWWNYDKQQPEMHNVTVATFKRDVSPAFREAFMMLLNPESKPSSVPNSKGETNFKGTILPK